MSNEAQVITDNLDELLAVLPAHLSEAIAPEVRGQLIEIVLDLGRRPEARFVGRYAYLSEHPVTREQLDSIETKLGSFGDDNRAGLPATLHRISAMRNRRGAIVGLTLRVGRAVTGIVDILRDIIESGQSVLLMGRPGLGKTTLLREMARVLADEVGKRVVIVDTSNEIAGDGDVPHPAIGRARRMQVARVAQQHDVMIEAVENHMPEVVVIDEIGRAEEALAARTIGERGVQLVATVHGNTLDNLLANPTLSDLIGGIGAVTLSDEEARRRGTQKTVLERKAPPTFGVVVEMIERDKIAVRQPIADMVDELLRGGEAQPELRWRDENGVIHRAQPAPALRPEPTRMGRQANGAVEERDARGRRVRTNKYAGRTDRYGRGREGGRDAGRETEREGRPGRSGREGGSGSGGYGGGGYESGGSGFGAGNSASGWNGTVRNGGAADGDDPAPAPEAATITPPSPYATRWDELLAHVPVDGEIAPEDLVDEEPDWDEPELSEEDADAAPLLPFSDVAFDPVKVGRIYPFGVSRSRMTRAIKQLGIPLTVTRTWQDADAVLMLAGGGLTNQTSLLREAREMGLPILGVRGNTYAQILARLNDIFGAAMNARAEGLSPRDVAIQEARDAVQRVLDAAEPVELRPQGRTLRRVQHQVAERFHLRSYSVGREPQRRVRFLPGTPKHK